MFTAQDFLNDPDVQVFDKLKKEELLSLGLHFGLEVKTNMKKQEIKTVVAKKLLSENIFTTYDFPKLEPSGMSELEFRLAMEKLKFEREEREREREEKERERQEREKERERERELEREKIKVENERAERENELRERESQRQFELEKLRLLNRKEVSPVRSEFDAAKNIRLVPKFQEKAVDKYFPQFEKVAANLKWPKKYWSTLLQSVLIGKAAEVYSALAIADSSDYDKVKAAILKSYQLIPEAYRQKFRRYKKFDNQTFVEFAREKEDLFDQWLRSQEIDNFQNFRQLILVEEFKDCVHQDLRTHLEDKNVRTLDQAAVISDTYTLSHKKNFWSKNQSSGSLKGSDSDKKNVSESKSSSTSNSQSPLNSGSTSGPRSGRSEGSSGVGSLPTCTYCKKRGHLISDCFKLKRKNDFEKPQPHACTAFRNDRKAFVSSCSGTPDVQGSKSSFVNSMEDYKPFLSQGFVSINGSSDVKPVQILRDTGAAQSLLLESVLPLSERTSTDKSVLLQGVELGVIDVPLHRIYLKSDLITGPVIVGVRPTLPVQGVSLLLGNDLAGGKVVPDPIVCEKLTSDVASDDENDDLYPACAVTRSMTRRKEVEEDVQPLDPAGSSHDLDLSDTFLIDLDGSSDVNSQPFKSDSQLKTNADDPNTDTQLNHDQDTLSREQLLSEQNKDPDIIQLSKKALPSEEEAKVGECFYIKDGILMQKW